MSDFDQPLSAIVKAKMKQRKIDIYLQDSKGIFVYNCSTMMAKNCREAKLRFCNRYEIEPIKVKATFAKR